MTWMNKASHQWSSRPDDERFVDAMLAQNKASHQWSSRPDDERFVDAMLAHFQMIRAESRETIASSRRVHCLPDPDNKGMTVTGPNGVAYAPTHWAFGQIAQLAEAPAGYLRTLPAPIAADNLNYGLQFKRSPEDVGFLLRNIGHQDARVAMERQAGDILELA